MAPARQVAAAVLMASAMTASLAVPAQAAPEKTVQPALNANPTNRAGRIQGLESGKNGLKAHRLSDVLSDLNRKTRKPAQCPHYVPGPPSGPVPSPAIPLHPNKGFCWDGPDTQTSKWRPQGLTHGSSGWLASWYTTKGKHQSRITLVNNSHTKYRHIALVDPGRQPHANFKPVNTHAGGIAQVGHYLYVADSGHGLRVFDLNHIWKADGGKRDDEYTLKNGKIHAAGYAYVLPQIGSYTAVREPNKYESCDKDKNPYFSSISYDENHKRLVSGEFCNKPKGGDKGKNGRLSLWQLGKDGQLGKRGETVHPKRWFITTLDSMQGVAVHGDTALATYSKGPDERGRWVPMKLAGKGNGNALHAGRSYKTAGAGPEDVTYVDNRYWTLTEYPKQRWVFPNDADQAG